MGVKRNPPSSWESLVSLSILTLKRIFLERKQKKLEVKVRNWSMRSTILATLLLFIYLLAFYFQMMSVWHSIHPLRNPPRLFQTNKPMQSSLTIHLDSLPGERKKKGSFERKKHHIGWSTGLGWFVFHPSSCPSWHYCGIGWRENGQQGFDSSDAECRAFRGVHNTPGL